MAHSESLEEKHFVDVLFGSDSTDFCKNRKTIHGAESTLKLKIM
jgi:hypothetical protein